jgi:peptidoglycan/xylan/chitin deacetylase (PgdA/CDA1 family)
MTELLTQTTAPISILTYHQIAPKPAKGTPFRSLCVDPRDFAKQMRWLKRLGYQGLSMGALMPYLLGEKTGKVVGITFDDGYQNNLVHALPELQRNGFSSTCYVVSQLIGKTNIWDKDVGIPQVPLMTSSELKLWMEGGQEVGAHTREHVHLPKLDSEQAYFEIAGCKSEIESLISVPVEHFCYPYGDYAAGQVEQVRQSKFRSATTTKRGRCYAGMSMFELPRVSVVRRTTRLGLAIKIMTGSEDRKGKG